MLHAQIDPWNNFLLCWSAPNVNAMLCSNWSAPFKTKWIPTYITSYFVDIDDYYTIY